MTPSLPARNRLEGVRAVWLVGVEGVGMSAAAEILAARGYVVRGADRAPGPRAARLGALGVPVSPEEDVRPSPDSDLVVASAAVPADHPHLADARSRGIEVWKYAELVGALMADRQAICIAGCHGKTTTTSLVASCLLEAGRDPTFVIGGSLLAQGSGARSGAGPHFVVESCEFDRSFHHHAPRIGVVLNVDEDHLDYYRDLAEIQEAFRVFAARVPADGLLVVNDAYAPIFGHDPQIVAPVETYGFGENATWKVGEPEDLGPGRGMRVALRYRGEAVGPLELPLIGRHNALNAGAATVALLAAGLSFDEAARGLHAFGGVGRRLEQVADRGGVLILDDYGHHPAEIRATVRALRKRHPDRRLIVVFQPHQASRTRCLLKDFAAALAEADEAWIPPIYFARDSEEERRSVTSEDLAAHVRNEGGRATTLPDLEAVVRHAAEEVRPGDVVVTMGAGNVDEVSRGLAHRLP
jgi:UDP-N-acetylmuramate--alanine ligase